MLTDLRENWMFKNKKSHVISLDGNGKASSSPIFLFSQVAVFILKIFNNNILYFSWLWSSTAESWDVGVFYLCKKEGFVLCFFILAWNLFRRPSQQTYNFELEGWLIKTKRSFDTA